MATDIERLTVQIDAQLVKFDKAMARMEGRAAASSKKVEKTFAGMQARMDKSFSAVGGSLRGALAIAGIGLGTRELIGYIDAWTKANNALKVAGLSGNELKTTMDALYAAAQRQGAPLEALTTLYGRAAQSQAELKATSGELIRFAEDVAIALRVAGTSPEEASGALLQLSQLLGSARVQAEEFNSINEGARPILQAVAAGIEEAGGSVSKLKALVTDGKVSNTAFFKGFQAGVQTIRDQAAAAEPTIGQAFTRLQNAVARLVGEVNQSSGFSAGLISELDRIAAGATRAIGPIGELIKFVKMLNDLPVPSPALLWSGANQAGLAANQALFGPVNRNDAIRQAMKSYNPADTFAASAEYDAALGFKNPYPPQKPISLKNYPVVGAKTKGGGGGPDDYQQEIKHLRERTEALQLETEALGKSTYETEKAKAAHDLLNAAKEAGRKITPELTAEIDRQAEAYARAAEAAEHAKEAYAYVQEVQQGLAGAFSGAVSAIRQGESAIDALSNSLGRLLDQIMDMISKQLFKQLFEGMGLSGFGFSAGGTVGGTSGASYVKAASGGAIRGPGSGTSDSIPAMLSNGEYVVRAAQARKYGALLDAINGGRLRLPHFATGGGVGAVPAMAGMGGVSVEVVNQTGVQAGAQAQMSRGADGRAMLRIVLGAVKKDMASGGFDSVQRGRFGVAPSPVRRG